jgi:hypothetical protein
LQSSAERVSRAESAIDRSAPQLDSSDRSRGALDGASRSKSSERARRKSFRLAWTTERRFQGCVAQARRFLARTKALWIVRSIVFKRIGVNHGSDQRRSSPMHGFALYREAVSGTEARSSCLSGGMERQRRKHDGKGSSSRKGAGGQRSQAGVRAAETRTAVTAASRARQMLSSSS